MLTDYTVQRCRDYPVVFSYKQTQFEFYFIFMSTNGECIHFSLAPLGVFLTLSVFQWLLDHLMLLMFALSTSLLDIWFHLINFALKMRWKPQH